MNSGKLVIIFIVIVAAGLSGFACWYHYQEGRLSLAFWGTENANLIRHAPQVELLTLAATSDGDETTASAPPSLDITGGQWFAVDTKDISAKGNFIRVSDCAPLAANRALSSAISNS